MGGGLQAGAVLEGRYRLDHPIGEGGMGVVWAGVHLITERRVAIKIQKGAGGRPSVRRRFLREARASSRIEHPSAVQVLDAFELEDGTRALVMDLLDGETLTARIARGRLSVEETAAVVVPIASVVAAAHALGIVHRDLKPDNVLLTHDVDAMRRVRVLDFGIALLARGDREDHEPATRSRALVGTPCYMAPEQAFGELDLDHRVDVWAIGVIAYEALTGGRPYEADNLGQLVERMLTDAFVPIEELIEDIPPEVSTLVARMLSRDRAQRPGDLGEVVEVFGALAPKSLPAVDEPRSELGDSAVARRSTAVPGARRSAPWLVASSAAAVAVAWMVIGPERAPPITEPTPLAASTPTEARARAEVRTSTPPEAARSSPEASVDEPNRPAVATAVPTPPKPRKQITPPAAPPPAASAAPMSSRPGLVTEPPY